MHCNVLEVSIYTKPKQLMNREGWGGADESFIRD